MKKRKTAKFTLLVMLLCIVFFITSCDNNPGSEEKKDTTEQLTSVDNLSVAEVENDPTGQVFTSAKETYSALQSNIPLVSTFYEAAKKGVFELSVLTDDEGSFNGKFYIDSAANTGALLANFDAYGEKFDAAINYTDKAIAFSCDKLLGKNIYGINLETFDTDIKNSKIWGLLGITYEDIQSQIDSLTNALNSLSENSEAGEKTQQAFSDFEIYIKDFLNKKVTSVEKRNVKVANEDVSSITVKYTLDKEALQEYMNKVLTLYQDIIANQISTLMIQNCSATELDSTFEELKDEINKLISESDKCEVIFEISFNVETGDIMLILFDLDILYKEYSAKIKFKADFGKIAEESPEWNFGISLYDNNEISNIDIKLSRQNSEPTYESTFLIKFDGEEFSSLTENELEFGIKNNKEENTFKLFFNLGENNMELSGTLLYTETTLDLTIDDITVSDEDIPEGLCIKLFVKAGEEVPEMPEYKNILTLSEEEIITVFQNIITYTGMLNYAL